MDGFNSVGRNARNEFIPIAPSTVGSGGGLVPFLLSIPSTCLLYSGALQRSNWERTRRPIRRSCPQRSFSSIGFVDGLLTCTGSWGRVFFLLLQCIFYPFVYGLCRLDARSQELTSFTRKESTLELLATLL
jgi:hypothetical protein